MLRKWYGVIQDTKMSGEKERIMINSHLPASWLASLSLSCWEPPTNLSSLTPALEKKILLVPLHNLVCHKNHKNDISWVSTDVTAIQRASINSFAVLRTTKPYMTKTDHLQWYNLTRLIIFSCITYFVHRCLSINSWTVILSHCFARGASQGACVGTYTSAVFKKKALYSSAYATTDNFRNI